MVRTPKAGETWVWKDCELHDQLHDVVVVGRSFEDQPEFIQQHIIARVYCGCQYAADDPDAAVRQLRQRELMEQVEFEEKCRKIMADGDRHIAIVIILLVLAVVLLWLIARS